MEIEKAFLQNNEKRMPLLLASSRKRGERVLMLSLAASRREWDEFSLDEKTESCSVIVQFKTGFTSKARITVVDAEK